MKPELHEQMMTDLALAGKAASTQKSYADCIRVFARVIDVPVERAERVHIARFVRHLVEERRLAPSSLSIYICALRFCFRHTVGRPEVVEGLRQPFVTQKVPEALTQHEVTRFLCHIRSLTHYTFACLLYGTGMRLGEGLAVTVDDIQSHRNLIVVRRSKTRRPRYVRMSDELLAQLRRYWKMTRPPRPLLFPGRDPERPLDPSVIQKAFKRAAEHAGLSRRVTPHVLRHSYATHMLESGVDVFTVQMLLGHGSPKTTRRYLHLSPQFLAGRITPIRPLIW